MKCIQNKTWISCPGGEMNDRERSAKVYTLYRQMKLITECDWNHGTTHHQAKPLYTMRPLTTRFSSQMHHKVQLIMQCNSLKYTTLKNVQPLINNSLPQSTALHTVQLFIRYNVQHSIKYNPLWGTTHIRHNLPWGSEWNTSKGSAWLEQPSLLPQAFSHKSGVPQATISAAQSSATG